MRTLSIHNLSVYYGKYCALDQIEAIFGEGITGILGPNGAGKSTLLKTLATLLPVNSGSISLNGLVGKENTIRWTNPNYIRHHIGYVPQMFGSYPYLTVYEVLHHIALMKGLEGRMLKKSIEQVLDQTHMEEQSKKRVGNLSGGMIRRLGIAQALLGQPDLLLIDEPTAGLDPEECIRFRMLLRGLNNDQSKIILLTTHIVADIDAVCDSIAILYGGKIKMFSSSNALSNCALGHIHEISMSDYDYSEFSKTHTIQALHKENDTVKVRYFSEEHEVSSCRPTTEDGYVWLLHHWNGA